jgi:nickel-dependent lactate racemase
MHVAVPYGHLTADLEVPEGALVRSRVDAPPQALPDPAAAVRAALERPHEFPPLRRALTPDDRVVVLVDERLPLLPSLLVPVLEHLLSAGISAEAITLLCPSPSGNQSWLEELPEELEEVRLEVHTPQDRRRLSFVTTMSQGRELLFNRTAVDAAQIVVLSDLRYDSLHGYGGGEGALYPAFSDRATRNAVGTRWSLDVPGSSPWDARQEAGEAVWLLGAPFFVQVIEGPNDSIADVVGGVVTSLPQGRRLLDAHWRHVVDGPADTVVATISGDPGRQTFADLADALACASRVLKPNGRIVLLTEARPAATAATALLTDAEDPSEALAEISRRQEYELRAAWQWATATQEHRVYLLSGLPEDDVESLFAFPLEDVAQVRRLVAAGEACLFLPDAHKTLALIEP